MPYLLASRSALNGRKGFLPHIIKQYRLEYMAIKDDEEEWQKWKATKMKEYSDRLKVRLMIWSPLLLSGVLFSLSQFRKACSLWHNHVLHHEKAARSGIRRKRRQE